VVTEVLPRLRSAVPVEFEVVGQLPLRPIEAPGVTYVGPVPSVRPHYERAHVIVVPVFEGSGTRLKVIEALASGRPLISTSLGAEGLHLTGGQHYFEASDVPGFVNSLTELANRLTSPDAELEAMLHRGQQAVAPLSWSQIVGRLIALYEEQLQSSRLQTSMAS
jgi:glycosyltransferase involved in cell wall biosynthesis